ncbi:hypothetical protein HAL013_12060 [Helicobacter ailurogastricus]|uniref:Uncharacterized protein n=1 Tax=Helicobacter ailurogastricus TaxID=1578720 RepID=A0A0K2X640_9HELI|nr:hypothetical protein HAL011_13200 [Helicobacter ailurogastricus]CRF42989.1 hypothetical protein HAL013_12060 [Helicobacter ailurogastricus]CRF43718.1 hypothetical protein HAL09_02670 [Helicobacter ailurogastricus]
MFLTLPASVKAGLSNLFKEDNPLAFMVAGTQYRNALGLHQQLGLSHSVVIWY